LDKIAVKGKLLITAKFLRSIYIEWKNGTLKSLNYSTFAKQI